MGNVVVLKPALLFAEICAEAGLPAGVFNVVTGPGSFGQALATHPLVDKVGFTGRGKGKGEGGGKGEEGKWRGHGRESHVHTHTYIHTVWNTSIIKLVTY